MKRAIRMATKMAGRIATEDLLKIQVVAILPLACMALMTARKSGHFAGFGTSS